MSPILKQNRKFRICLLPQQTSLLPSLQNSFKVSILGLPLLTLQPLFSFVQLHSHSHHSTKMFCQAFLPISIAKSPINGFFSCPLVNSLIFFLTLRESLCQLCPLYQTENLNASGLKPYRIHPIALNTTESLLLPNLYL